MAQPVKSVQRGQPLGIGNRHIERRCVGDFDQSAGQGVVSGQPVFAAHRVAGGEGLGIQAGYVDGLGQTPTA